MASLTDEKVAELAKIIQDVKDADTGKGTDGEAVNVLHVALMKSPESMAHEEGAVADVIAQCEAVFQRNQAALKNAGVRMVSLLFQTDGARQPRYLSFRECMDYKEDPVRRDMRPSFPYIFELGRLDVNYKLERLPTVGRNSQIYLGVERGGALKRATPQTLFLRAISHRPETYTMEGANQALLMAMDELERAMLDSRVNPACSSRIFLHMMPELNAVPGDVVAEWKNVMDTMISRHATRLLKLRVDEIEVKARISPDESSGKITPVRLMASSMSGQWLRVDGFQEYPDPITGVTKQWCSLTQGGDICMLNPYPASNSVQIRRAAARRIGTTYAPDFLGLMEVGLIGMWSEFLSELKDAAGASGTPAYTSMPGQLFESDELVLQSDGTLQKQFRVVGTNKVGMLAWHVMMRTPEYPEGREIVIIANDVTFQSGSFGVAEDDFFLAASEYARKLGLPRIYISSNSGARIGLVEELKPKFKVAWNDESNPAQGFKYLYLNAEDYEALEEGTVNAREVVEGGEKRYALTDIIGQVHGIGVENLRGSGMIAGETSRAYDEAFTLSYVTGRSVGIGAYLVRLGQRTIQMRNGPIILTGFSALNKLLGREVYTSQDQLGGPQVMHPNGVSHLEVGNDQEGVDRILQWLSYVPKTAGSLPVARPVTDPVEREVSVYPTKAPYDPRDLCRGKVGSDGSSWVPGFFDRGSYQEYLSGWGKSVVVGRARIGGIPMGVINVETRLSEQIIPADPANPDSREVIQAQAGQVWFPDSAYKTAQAINDFNRGENLPLMIFANWRGFSGGTRDMYGEILKFGAQIVDALVAYKHPVFVYIPPNGELRGGAWVVIDPTINDQVMEMYADAESRGGILEPPGICEVKFRAADQITKMHELDPVLQGLDGDVPMAGSEEDEQALKKQIKSREDALLPMYLQVAHEFADLHDRSGRMKAKGVVRDILEWKTSREYFYWRVKRRLAENGVRKMFKDADPSMSFDDTTKLMQSLCPDWENDKAVLDWVESDQSSLKEYLAGLRSDAVRRDVTASLSTLTPEQKAKVLEGL
ncbi:Acetyl-CoA carboxylase [Ectocarpus siliculosus]|uniref:Acetyl-CoA carboxylase, partial n=1 Tax=Ectocarpus siliculosus TaxID=2880 RepID=D7FZG6_ECTSI|nr:Acetyl-CoA carboxylase [Ectocarpus siliculosus]|eukprot:CBJ32783.1 Acetyl-CoA carboxylase [Ectocarpus siliculosus]